MNNFEVKRHQGRDCFPISSKTAFPVFYRTYSRFDNDQREYWDEVCLRSAQGLRDLGNLTSEETRLIYDQSLLTHAMPSGRWLWVGGTDWIKKPENFHGAYNCFHGDTEVLTKEFGYIKIKDAASLGKLHVFNIKSQWKSVHFSNYGGQHLTELVLKRGKFNGPTQTLKVTADHDWFVQSRNQIVSKKTSELGHGDIIPFRFPARPVRDLDVYRLGVQHGIVYGDGSSQGSKGASSLEYKVRLCGEKSELLSYFPEMDGHKVLYCPSYKGDPLVMIDKSSFHPYVEKGNLKSLPVTNDESYLSGFLRGLIAADGSVTRPSSTTINVYGDLETLEFVQAVAPIVGIEPQLLRILYRAGENSNLGKRNKDLWSLNLFAGTMTEDDFLRSSHTSNFVRPKSEHLYWRVIDIYEGNEYEKVYCCEEEETHSFTLANGILTGNCTSTNMSSLDRFGLLMELAMMGSGTGAILERKYTDQLPDVCTHLTVIVEGSPGDVKEEERRQGTSILYTKDDKGRHLAEVVVGDSRQGWADAYQSLLNLATQNPAIVHRQVKVRLGNVRPKGEKLKGFGGTANPAKLGEMFPRIAKILNGCFDRDGRLTPTECCLLIDEAATVVVAGNIRRSAGMRQFDSDAELLKVNLWQEDPETHEWRIDPDRDALRMANHTRVFHHVPSRDEVIESVKIQYQCGEGAIQFAPEAERRSQGEGRYGLNPCGEIIGQDFHCNLAEIHLNTIDPHDIQAQIDAFEAGALSVAVLLNHKFVVDIYQKSREEDPIVGVSITGLFDFFVHAFGIRWLEWWAAGRERVWGETTRWSDLHGETCAHFIGTEGEYFACREEEYLSFWKKVVNTKVWDYCDRHNLKRPNRCTTVQPAGTKSLLTGASPGWHPPKAQRFIRRITFGKNDPVAKAAIDYGYSVVPSQSDKDENGALLTDPYDPRCTEWLVEIPVEVSWANLDGADKIHIENFSALAQFDFYMQVQNHYVTHNTSATIEFYEEETEDLATAIWASMANGSGYISAALMARYHGKQTFPRLPFEPIDKDTYQSLCIEVLNRQTNSDFHAALTAHDTGETEAFNQGPAACDGDRCLMPEPTPG